jgi:hypothetical protein
MDTIAIRSNGVVREARQASSCISRKSAEPRARKAGQAVPAGLLAFTLLAHAEIRDASFCGVA